MAQDRIRITTIQLGIKAKDAKGEEHQSASVPRACSYDKAWLPRRTYGHELGPKAHYVNPYRSVQDVQDSIASPRKKPEAISSGQWEEKH